MRRINKIICGSPCCGTIRQRIRCSAPTVYISFAAIILVEIVSLFACTYQIAGGIFATVFMVIWFVASMMHVQTIADLNARIIRLENARKYEDERLEEFGSKQSDMW